VAYTSVPILVFLGLSVLELGPMYATDRQTDSQYQYQSQIYLARASFVIKNAIGGTVSDVRQKHRYMRPPYEAEA